MIEDLLACPICYFTYNDSSNTPKILECGHTLCSECLDKILLQNFEQKKCPLDKRLFSRYLLTVSDFPVNYALKNLTTNSTSPDKVCQIHNKALKYVCLQDTIGVCTDCVQEGGSHEGHKFRSFDKIHKDRRESQQRLTQYLEDINIYVRRTEEAFKDEAKGLICLIQNEFEQLISKIKAKEAQLCIDAETLCELKTQKVRDSMSAYTDPIRQWLLKLQDTEDLINILSDPNLPKAQEDSLRIFKKENIDKLLIDMKIRQKQNIEQVAEKFRTMKDDVSNISLNFNTQDGSFQVPQGLVLSNTSAPDYSTLTLSRTINTSHKKGIIKALLLNDDTRVITCSADNSIQIYDIKSGLALGTLLGHNKAVQDIIMLSNGLLASCSDDGSIRIWNLSQMACKKVLKSHTAQVYRLLELPNRTLISTSYDASIKVWDLKSDDIKCLRTIRNPDGNLVFACVSLNNEDIAYGSLRNIFILQFETGIVKKILSGHTNVVRDLLILSDRNSLISGSQDCTIRIWNLALSECRLVLNGHISIVSKVVLFSAEVLMSASLDGTIRFWDLKTGKCLKALQGDRDEIYFVASMNDKSLLSVGAEQLIRIWH